ncbi:hypothetical protein [Geminocystis sp. GBBB08]|uniref:hypothetical protein n=1 Tax=Geminocystis sp. GBBB08 TaxID=2604140 RepID=UPI0027E2F51C|nr:hypothetical protein [Geminocystis sp. GBBB08]MBL1210050.1 hypothetical protein [Geminocystis sp. GBBB08]
MKKKKTIDERILKIWEKIPKLITNFILTIWSKMPTKIQNFITSIIGEPPEPKPEPSEDDEVTPTGNKGKGGTEKIGRKGFRSRRK